MEKPAYIIAMGQGIIGEGPNFSVKTTALYSCVLICGYNSSTKMGGAFHYPANILILDEPTVDDKLTISEMSQWIKTLTPDEVSLVYPDNSPGNATSATPEDVQAVAKWVTETSGVQNVTKVGGGPAGGMIVATSGAFTAGNVSGLWDLGFPDDDEEDLSKYSEGKHSLEHGKVVLFGKDLDTYLRK